MTIEDRFALFKRLELLAQLAPSVSWLALLSYMLVPLPDTQKASVPFDKKKIVPEMAEILWVARYMSN